MYRVTRTLCTQTRDKPCLNLSLQVCEFEHEHGFAGLLFWEKRVGAEGSVRVGLPWLASAFCQDSLCGRGRHTLDGKDEA